MIKWENYNLILKEKPEWRKYSCHIIQGYEKVGVCFGIKKLLVFTHILTLLEHSQPPTPYHEVNHKNGIKSDNRLENLEWVTKSENKFHAIKELGIKTSFMRNPKQYVLKPNQKPIHITNGLAHYFFNNKQECFPIFNIQWNQTKYPWFKNHWQLQNIKVVK